MRPGQWNRGGWIYRKRRTQRHDKIGFFRGIGRALQFDAVEILSEADRCNLQEPATFAARTLPIFAEIFIVRCGIASRATTLTLHHCIGSMQLNQVIPMRAGTSTHAVDILGDHHQNTAGILQFHNRLVNRIRLRLRHCGQPFELVVPVFDTSRDPLEHGQSVEVNSIESAHVQASDVAAGYARELYCSTDGLKKVCDAYRTVILNGDVIKHASTYDRWVY